MLDAHRREQRPLPSPHYLHVIVEGAREHRLPADYVDKLRRLEHNGYAGPIDVQLAVLSTFVPQRP